MSVGELRQTALLRWTDRQTDRHLLVRWARQHGPAHTRTDAALFSDNNGTDRRLLSLLVRTASRSSRGGGGGAARRLTDPSLDVAIPDGAGPVRSGRPSGRRAGRRAGLPSRRLLIQARQGRRSARTCSRPGSRDAQYNAVGEPQRTR